jgi:CRISPR-associated protein Cas1
MQGDDEQDFRQAIIDVLTRAEALDLIIETLKEMALNTGKAAP